MLVSFGKHTGHQSIASHFQVSNRMDYREVIVRLEHGSDLQMSS